jgi:hypothetical protein
MDPKPLEEFLQLPDDGLFSPPAPRLPFRLHLLPLTYIQLATIPSGLTPGEECGKDFLFAWEAQKLVEQSGLKIQKRTLP